MRLHRAFTALAAIATLTACEENAVQDISGPAPTAAIKFFNFAVGAPTVHFYSGSTKLTASTSANCRDAKSPPATANDSTCLATGRPISGGIGYGGVSSGALYTGMAPGQYTFSARVTDPARDDYDAAITSIPATLADGGAYSYYTSGFYDATTETADAFLVEDDFPAAIDWTTAHVRFVNAIGNSEPMTLYAVNADPELPADTIAIGGPVAYRSAGAFVPVPPGLYNLHTRYTGSTTNRIVRTSVAFDNGFVYTITARGDMTVTSTTATNRPFLDNTRNR